MRNDTARGTGAMELDYTLDASDFGGLLPSSANISNVMMEFYFCPNPGSNPPLGAGEKFVMSLKDSSLTTGLEIGYDYNNNVFWRNTANYNYSSGIIANSSNYDGFRVNIDLINDTFSLDYLQVATSSVIPLVASGTPLLAPLQDFTHIGWKLNDQVQSGIGGKNFFDDFNFTVTTTKTTPEPSMSLPLSIIGLGLLILSRKRPSGT